MVHYYVYLFSIDPGDMESLIKQLNDYPIEGLEEVLVVKDGSVLSIYP